MEQIDYYYFNTTDMSYLRKIRDVESYVARLRMFLNDKLLRFNPYLIENEKLLEGIDKMRWRGMYSLTQMVILKFLDIQKLNDSEFSQEKVIYTIGDSAEEITEHMSAFTCKRTAADSLQQIRSTINNRPITQTCQIHSLIGKRIFVSRNVTTITSGGSFGKAMRMHRLKGNPEEDAAIIREAAVAAKLEMLKRLLAYPHANIYLGGEPSAPADIRTPIRALMAEISAFPRVVPP